ncbi:hypothetical protein L0P88_19195 [Muricauda sp. SCSIO 64092]|uniref:hypothetical protein n=1 Tax=Allomuricauda sp. SCSIO 64092 TaxID=2908842 RepID=UPI001FF386CD|nr:hypothetical protein [Muricauda sp. SCSIO 64092]UOY06039.1 hypothetical protein L0P88_19195 [Muricauda sp. SCSIO 64092]
MKKHILYFLVLIIVMGQMNELNAQFRRYPEPVLRHADDDDGAGLGPGDGRIVDRYGNPGCCESSGEFNFTLTFSSFNNLLALENRMLAAQKAALDRWLRKQEETFRKEINRQMGKNYSSFSTAQKEFFKFYEGGRYGNKGPVELANKLSFNNFRWTQDGRERTKSEITKYTVLDNWIDCGYCQELEGFAYAQGDLAQYDVDTGPGPKFYAKVIRDGTFNSFGKKLYAAALNKKRAEGLKEMAQNDYLLNRISKMRVDDYKKRGWQDRVFLMSAYLINANIYCPSPYFTCLPSQLAKYKPPVMWSEDILYKWAEDFGPEIPLSAYVFSEDYANEPNSYFVKLYGHPNWIYYKNNIARTRVDVTRAILGTPDENKICSGLRWSDIGDSFYTTMTNLRLKAVRTFLGFPVGYANTISLPNICIEIPNFERINGKKVKIPDHRATTRLKSAWSSAVAAISVDEATAGRDLTDAEYGTILIRNLNILLQEFRVGSTASAGHCSGSKVSNIKFCKD